MEIKGYEAKIKSIEAKINTIRKNINAVKINNPELINIHQKTILLLNTQIDLIKKAKKNQLEELNLFL